MAEIYKLFFTCTWDNVDYDSIFLLFFFYVCTIILSSFVLRHRYINVDASNIQNIHTQVSAVHSVSDAVSVVFVSVYKYECCVAHFERQDISNLYSTIKRRKRTDITVAEDKDVSNSNIAQ